MKLTHVTAHLDDRSGSNVTIHAPTIELLQALIARQAGTVTSAPNLAVQVRTGDQVKAPKPETPATTPAPPAASTELGAAAGDAQRPTYDDIASRVKALVAKVGRDKALGVLGKFGVDHGNKLKLEQYPGFIKLADETLAEVPA